MSSTIVRSIRRAMERVAPLHLAESWDNVGLILEAPFQRPDARRVLITIDLTTAVTEEALRTPTAFIVTYHTPIFTPLKSFTLTSPLQRSLLRCAAAGVSVYCPHTALDAVDGGVNDWLVSIVSRVEEREEVTKTETDPHIPSPARKVTLKKPISLAELTARIKKGLNLQHIQVASPADDMSVCKIAICAGSGGSLLAGVDADVYFTGEAQHHDILATVAAGRSIILCGHDNTERGYLPTLAQRLQAQLEIDTEARAGGWLDSRRYTLARKTSTRFD